MSTKNDRKHSPTPWKAKHYAQGASIIRSIGTRELVAAECSPTDAELIVRAVNAHEALVKACKELLPYAIGLSQQVGATPGNHDAIKLAQHALKLAKGEC